MKVPDKKKRPMPFVLCVYQNVCTYMGIHIYKIHTHSYTYVEFTTVYICISKINHFLLQPTIWLTNK
jgi:hypothetical protein